jgi:hypothetical protein
VAVAVGVGVAVAVGVGVAVAVGLGVGVAVAVGVGVAVNGCAKAICSPCEKIAVDVMIMIETSKNNTITREIRILGPPVGKEYY